MATDITGQLRHTVLPAQATVLAYNAIASKTVAAVSADQKNANYGGVRLYITQDTLPANSNVTVSVQGKDEVLGKYSTIWTAPTITAVGTYVYDLAPMAPAATSTSFAGFLGSTWRVSAISNTTTNNTVGVTGQYLPFLEILEGKV